MNPPTDLVAQIMAVAAEAHPACGAELSNPGAAGTSSDCRLSNGGAAALTQDSEPPNPINAQTPAPKNRNRSPITRMAIRLRLPIEILNAVSDAVRAAKEFNEELVRSLDERYELRNKYLISPLGLRTFLYRIRAPDGTTPTINLAKHRRRQKSIAELLDHFLGPWRKCRPELWEHRTFLMLVGILYDRLATNEKEIPTKELVAMSKALAEQRRAQAQSGGPRESDAEKPRPGDGQLPENFPEVVKQIYGTNFQGEVRKP